MQEFPKGLALSHLGAEQLKKHPVFIVSATIKMYVITQFTSLQNCGFSMDQSKWLPSLEIGYTLNPQQSQKLRQILECS